MENKFLTDQDFTSLLLAETGENTEENRSINMFNEYERKAPGRSIIPIRSDCKGRHRNCSSCIHIPPTCSSQ